jgi:hypothetical protein
MARRGAPVIHRPGENAKLADPRNVVALGCGRHGTRDLICPADALATCRRAAPRCKAAEGMPATRLRATSLHRVVGAAVLAGVYPFPRSPCQRAPPRAKRRRSAASQRLRKRIGLIVHRKDVDVHGAPPMAMTATERSRVLRERRGCGRRGSRGLISPAAALATCRRAAPRAKAAQAMLATRLRATSLHRAVSAVVLAGVPLSTLAACRRAAPRAKRRRSAAGQ